MAARSGTSRRIPVDTGSIQTVSGDKTEASGRIHRHFSSPYRDKSDCNKWNGSRSTAGVRTTEPLGGRSKLDLGACIHWRGGRRPPSDDETARSDDQRETTSITSCHRYWWRVAAVQARDGYIDMSFRYPYIVSYRRIEYRIFRNIAILIWWLPSVTANL